jgi:PadR family transcriptional regulator, regulatory protein PadR
MRTSCGGVGAARSFITTVDIGVRYDNPVRSFLHGAVQLHVLHHAAEHPIHGAWMAAELARHGYQISPGTLYPTLHRLEAAGLLSGHDDLEAGRRIRRYTITDAGRLALAEARRALRELCHELLLS